MSFYWTALGLTVLGNIGYQLCQKTIRPEASPWMSLMATFATAFLCSAAAFQFFPREAGWARALGDLGPSSFALGVTIILVELGYLLAYRAGWAISRASLVSNLAVALALVPIGILAFSETMTLKRAVGVLMAVAGLAMIAI